MEGRGQFEGLGARLGRDGAVGLHEDRDRVLPSLEGQNGRSGLAGVGRALGVAEVERHGRGCYDEGEMGISADHGQVTKGEMERKERLRAEKVKVYGCSKTSDVVSRWRRWRGEPQSCWFWVRSAGSGCTSSDVLH